jgi:uncharacterized protein (DUF4415 family)
MKKKRLTTKDGDALPLTRTIIRGMQPMSKADPGLVARWKKEQKRRGRPSGRRKAVVSLSLDNEVIHALRKSGKGWQTRVNDLLKAAVGL